MELFDSIKQAYSSIRGTQTKLEEYTKEKVSKPAPSIVDDFLNFVVSTSSEGVRAAEDLVPEVIKKVGREIIGTPAGYVAKKVISKVSGVPEKKIEQKLKVDRSAIVRGGAKTLDVATSINLPVAIGSVVLPQSLRRIPTGTKDGTGKGTGVPEQKETSLDWLGGTMQSGAGYVKRAADKVGIDLDNEGAIALMMTPFNLIGIGGGKAIKATSKSLIKSTPKDIKSTIDNAIQQTTTKQEFATSETGKVELKNKLDKVLNELKNTNEIKGRKVNAIDVNTALKKQGIEVPKQDKVIPPSRKDIVTRQNNSIRTFDKTNEVFNTEYKDISYLGKKQRPEAINKLVSAGEITNRGQAGAYLDNLLLANKGKNALRSGKDEVIGAYEYIKGSSEASTIPGLKPLKYDSETTGYLKGQSAKILEEGGYAEKSLNPDGTYSFSFTPKIKEKIGEVQWEKIRGIQSSKGGIFHYPSNIYDNLTTHGVRKSANNIDELQYSVIDKALDETGDLDFLGKTLSKIEEVGNDVELPKKAKVNAFNAKREARAIRDEVDIDGVKPETATRVSELATKMNINLDNTLPIASQIDSLNKAADEFWGRKLPTPTTLRKTLTRDELVAKRGYKEGVNVAREDNTVKGTFRRIQRELKAFVRAEGKNTKNRKKINVEERELLEYAARTFSAIKNGASLENLVDLENTIKMIKKEGYAKYKEQKFNLEKEIEDITKAVEEEGLRQWNKYDIAEGAKNALEEARKADNELWITKPFKWIDENTKNLLYSGVDLPRKIREIAGETGTLYKVFVRDKENAYKNYMEYQLKEVKPLEEKMLKLLKTDEEATNFYLYMLSKMEDGGKAVKSSTNIKPEDIANAVDIVSKNKELLDLYSEIRKETNIGRDEVVKTIMKLDNLSEQSALADIPGYVRIIKKGESERVIDIDDKGNSIPGTEFKKVSDAFTKERTYAQGAIETDARIVIPRMLKDMSFYSNMREQVIKMQRVRESIKSTAATNGMPIGDITKKIMQESIDGVLKNGNYFTGNIEKNVVNLSRIASSLKLIYNPTSAAVQTSSLLDAVARSSVNKGMDMMLSKNSEGKNFSDMMMDTSIILHERLGGNITFDEIKKSKGQLNIFIDNGLVAMRYMDSKVASIVWSGAYYDYILKTHGKKVADSIDNFNNNTAVENADNIMQQVMGTNMITRIPPLMQSVVGRILYALGSTMINRMNQYLIDAPYYARTGEKTKAMNIVTTMLMAAVYEKILRASISIGKSNIGVDDDKRTLDERLFGVKKGEKLDEYTIARWAFKTIAGELALASPAISLINYDNDSTILQSTLGDLWRSLNDTFSAASKGDEKVAVGSALKWMGGLPKDIGNYIIQRGIEEGETTKIKITIDKGLSKKEQIAKGLIPQKYGKSKSKPSVKRQGVKRKSIKSK